MKNTCALTVFMALGFFIATGLAQAGKRAFSIADQFRIVEVSDPQVSPDGNWIAYVTTHTDLKANKRWSHIWIMRPDGSRRRQLTQTEALNSAPRWSPRSDTLAFLSKRGKADTQLYLLPLAGGEARRLTDFPGGIGDMIWSPDGNHLALTAGVYPDCGADAECNRKIRKAWKDGPLKAHLADGLLYRHWESWRDGTYSHILLASVADGTLVDLTPGSFDAPGWSLGGGRGFSFSPDGQELTFVSNHDAKPAESTNGDLWQIRIQQGKPRGEAQRLTTNPAWDGDPAYSPDGRFIAYRTQKIPGYEADRFRLALHNRTTRKHRILTEAFDNWITDFRWAPDGKGIVFVAKENGRTPLYRLSPGNRRIRRVINHATILEFVIEPNGNQLVFSGNSVNSPTELYRANLLVGKSQQLTQHNEGLRKEVDFRPVEERWVTAADGKKIHVFLVKPHRFDPGKKYPVILKVHGGPQGMYGDRYNPDFQVMAGLGYVMAFSNPRGSVGYGQEFTRAISRDWGGKVYQDLMNVVDAVAELPYVDEKRMGAMGWSFGGYMMMWFQGHTDRFKAIAAMMGVYDLPSMYGATEELWFPEYDFGGAPWESKDYQKFNPSQFVPNFKTPCLVITGENDFRVPYTQSLNFFTALQKRNVPSRLVVLSEAGHSPGWYDMAFYYLLHADWFHRHLGGGPPPWDVQKFLRNQVFQKEGAK